MDVGEKPLLAARPAVSAWMGRMRDFGTGVPKAISGIDAWRSAKDATPEISPDDQQDTLIGAEVSIAPADYGLDPTHGRLVGSSPTRWIIAREQAQVGL